MKPISDIRRENLAQLVATEATQAAAAARIGKDRNQIHQWLLDPSAAGARNISGSSARLIEAAFGKPLGWLDHEREDAPAHKLGEPPVKYRIESGSSSQTVRTDPDKMRDALYFLELLAELQGVPSLARDPIALSIAYDFLVEFDQPTDQGNVLDITKRIAARIRGGNGDNDTKGTGTG